MYREVRGLSAGNIDIASVEGSPPKLIEQIRFEPEIIQKTLEKYEARIVKSPVEHALIISTAGEVYHCNGDAHGIPLRYFEQLKDKLIGAHVTHNPPPNALENENTFSDEDFKNYKRFKMARLRGIDEKFLYELNKNSLENEFIGYDLEV